MALSLLERSPYAGHAATALDKIQATLPAALAGRPGTRAVRTVASPSGRAAAAWIDATEQHRLVQIQYAEDRAVRTI